MWTRAKPSVPPPQSNVPGWPSWLPFGADSSSAGYSRLSAQERGAVPPPQAPPEDEEGWLSLSRWDRTLLFVGLNVGAFVMFFICFILFPTGVFMIKPRKFAILWTMGSVLFLSSWAALWGPMAYVKHLLSGPRIAFTAAYFGSIFLTLYFSIGLGSTFLTLVSSIIQMVCLVWFLISYFPFGSNALWMASSVGANWMSSNFV